jgi:hypothetical protein
MSSVLIGIALVTVCAILYAGGWYHGSRRQEVARRLNPLELEDMAEKIGVDLDFKSLGDTHEGSRLLDAMILCEECRAVGACHRFLDAEAEPAGRLTSFCPNAIFLLGLVEGRRREVSAGQGI